MATQGSRGPRPIDIAIQLAGGTQELLAERIGCSQAAVSKWVRGKPIGPLSAKQIEKAFPESPAVRLEAFCPEFAPLAQHRKRRAARAGAKKP